MKRGIVSVLAGLVAWFCVATAVNFALRVAWPDYAAAEKPMTFTLGMQSPGCSPARLRRCAPDSSRP